MGVREIAFKDIIESGISINILIKEKVILELTKVEINIEINTEEE